VGGSSVWESGIPGTKETTVASKSPRFFVVYEDEPADMGQVEYVLMANGCEWVEHCRASSSGDQFEAGKYDGLIVLGGGNFCHERELKWMREALDPRAGKAVLGICQGAQVLAVAAGGGWGPDRTGEPPLDHGVGPLAVRDRERIKDTILEGLENNQRMYQWHRCEYRKPGNAVDLVQSGNEFHPHSDAFLLADKRSYGLQFHPEKTSSDLLKLTNGTVSRERCRLVAAVGWTILDKWVRRVAGT
jgi:GMP synthase-like glutamine amidotransferase